MWHGVVNLTCTSDACVNAFSDGDTILAYFDMNPDHFRSNIICLIILIIGWRLLSFVVLLIKSKKH
jgi:hypothetical protein